MKGVKHGEAALIIVEQRWEKSYFMAQQGTLEWVPIFLHGETTPVAEIDPVSCQMRFCLGRELFDQQEVVFHDV